MRLSLRTFAITILGLGSVALLRTALELNAADETAVLVISDYGEASIVGFSAVCALVCAVAMRRTLPAQKGPWVLIALGILSFAAGDVIWSYQEIWLGMDPYPGIADIFYILQYVLLGSAMIVAGTRAGSPADRGAAFGFSASIGAFALVLLWVLLLEPHVLGSDIPPGPEMFLALFYPVADVTLLFAPAVFVALVMSRVGNGGWAWPWATVAAGAFVLSASDAGFSWLEAYGAYAGGGLVDYGWSLSSVLLAIGVSLARDLTNPAPSAVVLVSEMEDVEHSHSMHQDEASGA